MKYPPTPLSGDPAYVARATSAELAALRRASAKASEGYPPVAKSAVAPIRIHPKA